MARKQMKMYPLETFGDLLTLDEFLKCVRGNYFIDDDGFGYWATNREMDKDSIVMPSKFETGEQKPPKWATHVIWFNR